MTQQTINLRIRGMTCQGCADGIKIALKRQKGVREVKIDHRAGTGLVVIDPEVITAEAILNTHIFHRGLYSAERAGQIRA